MFKLNKRAGYTRLVVPCFFIVLFIFLPGLSFAQESAAGVSYSAAACIKKAQDLHLSQNPYWRVLVHYKKTITGGYKSLVDDPLFFLAKDGKTNPESELEATLQAFFEPKISGIPHATARFPARYDWLRNQLSVPVSAFPYNGDIEYLALKDKIKPGAVYLVFPNGYMKNPASLFGHTFLLIESAGKSRLLAYSVNYGAVTGDKPGILYAFKGLFGIYRGYYNFIPYYQKIQEYGDIDMRDMWEYRLKLSDQEIDRLLRHVVEMGSIYSQYYYMSENCSYNLLFLLESAKPETKATEKVGKIVEPIETVKLIYKLGCTDGVTYRPSLYTKIEEDKKRLSDREKTYVKKVCLGKVSAEDFPFVSETVEQQAAIWDLSSDYLKFLLNSGKISAHDYRIRIISVLSARKNLAAASIAEDQKIPDPPHEAHGSSRVSFTGGKDSNGFFSGAGFRLTAHELLDSDAGYTKNSQLAFCCFDAKYNYASRTVSLIRADVLDIISLPVSDSFFLNHGFAFRTGLETNQEQDGTDSLAWRLKLAYGISVRPVNWLQLYCLPGFDSFFSPSYSYGTDLLFGGEIGLVADFKNVKERFCISVGQSPFSADHRRYAVSTETSIKIAQNCSFSGTYSFQGDYGVFTPSFGLAVNVYF